MKKEVGTEAFSLLPFFGRSVAQASQMTDTPASNGAGPEAAAACNGGGGSLEPMKYIVVTGGVVSGLGKGVTISSIGRMLKNCGLRTTSIKIDPYLVGGVFFSKLKIDDLNFQASSRAAK